MKILIAAPCRQDEETFQEYLKSLDRLEIPEGVTVDRLFILHNSPNLVPYVKGYLYHEYQTDDDYPRGETTHQWTSKNVRNISNMKNAIAQYMLNYGYDYVFMVDTDLILHPKTLIKLLEAQKDIVAEIFWTKWTPEGEYLPNCWMYDSYSGVTEENVKLWAEHGLYQVGMTGACILIHRKVFEAGVNYNDICCISYDGEDRFFGIRAAVHGFTIWIDTHYPCLHLYRKSELEKYKQSLKGGDIA